MLYLSLLISFFILSGSICCAADPVFDLRASRQLVVVITDTWDAPGGVLYTMDKQNEKWQLDLPPRPVVVGKNGLGWGINQAPELEGPRKKEGDGKAPAGLFPLGKLMGYASAAPSSTRLSYAAITAATRCVDDSNSTLYNRIVEQRQDTPPDWTFAEKMSRRDDLYKWLIVVQYNDSPPQPGQGSCIFLHIWRAQGKGTAGCTAMTEQSLLDVARWLDPDKFPLLLQLPKHIFAQLPELASIQKVPH